VVPVNDESAALNDGPGHLHVLRAQVEVSEQANHVSRQHLLAFSVDRDLPQAEAASAGGLVGVGYGLDNLVEQFSGLLELSRAQMDHASVQFIDDINVQLLQLVLAVGVGRVRLRELSCRLHAEHSELVLDLRDQLLGALHCLQVLLAHSLGCV